MDVNEKHVKAELIAICHRYQAAQAKQLGETTAALDRLSGVIQQFVNSAQCSPQEFINQLHEPIPGDDATSKSIWMVLQEQTASLAMARQQNRLWERVKSFFVLLGAIFFGITAIIARIKTGRGNPLRLLKDPTELFVEDVQQVGVYYSNQATISSVATVSAGLTTLSAKPGVVGPSPFREHFDGKNDDVLNNILAYVKDWRDLHALAGTSRALRSLARPQWLARKFLDYVIKGEQEKARKMLDSWPELLLQRGVVTDYSGREFTGVTINAKEIKGVTAIQVASWGLDPDMLEMMKPFLTKINGGKEAALHQLEELETHGLNYRYVDADGSEKQEVRSRSYCNGEDNPLKKAYEEFVDKYDISLVPGQPPQEASRLANNVSLAQQMLPQALAMSFFQPYSFSKPPEETQVRQPLIRTLQFDPAHREFATAWFPWTQDKRIIIIHRFSRKNGPMPWTDLSSKMARTDCDAYSAICDVRKAQIAEFKNYLLRPDSAQYLKARA